MGEWQALTPANEHRPGFRHRLETTGEPSGVAFASMPRSCRHTFAAGRIRLLRISWRNSDRARVIALYNIHTKETISVLYKKDGKYIDAGLEKASWALRDWRRNEATKMDPELIDLLWEMHAELGSKEPIHIISGFRSRSTNDMLRRTTGGQASESRHILGKAADVHFPDVPLRNLRYSALIRERGGVGYYPTSALPFVHVDTDRVRAWPRLPRYELALLFPQGRTQHMPAEGGPISREDVSIARSQHKELATQIAEYRTWRDNPSSLSRLPMRAGASGLPRNWKLSHLSSRLRAASTSGGPART